MSDEHMRCMKSICFRKVIEHAIHRQEDRCHMNWNTPFFKYVQAHVPHYFFVTVLLLMGVLFGSMLVNALTLEQKEELTQFVQHFVSEPELQQANRSFLDSFMLQMKWLLLILLLGLSVIGFPGILLVIFFKGILVGFSIGYLMSELSWKGIVLAFASIAPQNIMLIPIMLICSVYALSFSLYHMRTSFFRKTPRIGRAVRMSEYFLTMLAATILLLGVSMFETMISPLLVQWVTQWLFV